MARRLEIKRAKPAPPTFVVFEKLPRELKNSIWLYSLPGPRVVEISFQSHDEFTGGPAGHGMQARSNTKAPSILHVNKESRSEAKIKYLALDLGPDIHIPNSIYVDFSIDTVYLSKVQLHNIFSYQNMRRTIQLLHTPRFHDLQWLVIDKSVWAYLSLPFLKTSCPNLKSLTITFQQSTLGDIKPASAAETVRLMYEKEYFTHPAARSIWAADWGILSRARSDLSGAKSAVLESFRRYEGDQYLDQQTDQHLGVVRPEIVGGFDWQLVFQGRRYVDLKFGVALYPRESKFENLRPSNRLLSTD